MSPNEFLRRVTVDTALVVGVVALVAASLDGSAAGIGVVAGGALAVGNLWWLVGRPPAVSSSRDARARWALAAVLRLAVIAGACAALLASRLAHPVGVLIGLTVLPGALVVRGLREARDA